MPANDIPEPLLNALRYLDLHYSGLISPGSLARIANLPLRDFSSLIKRIYGINPNQLIMKRRVDAACLLLRATNLSISEIAAECGFYDQGALNRAFRTICGVSPCQFRSTDTSTHRHSLPGRA